MSALRGYEDFYNTHRPHRTLNQAAPLSPLPDSVDAMHTQSDTAQVILSRAPIPPPWRSGCWATGR
jgi:hypothetical protein